MIARIFQSYMLTQPKRKRKTLKITFHPWQDQRLRTLKIGQDFESLDRCYSPRFSFALRMLAKHWQYNWWYHHLKHQKLNEQCFSWDSTQNIDEHWSGLIDIIIAVVRKHKAKQKCLKNHYLQILTYTDHWLSTTPYVDGKPTIIVASMISERIIKPS